MKTFKGAITWDNLHDLSYPNLQMLILSQPAPPDYDSDKKDEWEFDDEPDGGGPGEAKRYYSQVKESRQTQIIPTKDYKKVLSKIFEI